MITAKLKTLEAGYPHEQEEAEALLHIGEKYEFEKDR